MREYKNKKILITGNTGFKGTWLTLTLKLLGANIVGYSDKRPKKKISNKHSLAKRKYKSILRKS